MPAKYILIPFLACQLLLTANAQRPGRHHASSHGGYLSGRPGFSHNGGIFKKVPPVKKSKKIIKNPQPVQ